MRRLLLILYCGAVAGLHAQNPVPPSDTALAGITARGRLLAEYDQVAWHASDAVVAKWPQPTGVTGFLAMQNPAGAWHFLMARLNPAQDTLLVGAIADQIGKTEAYNVTVYPTPTPGSDVERRAFRAMITAGRELGSGPRPFNGQYNSYVLPQADGSWLVYFLPANVQAHVYLHGGDFRYVVSADGATILAKFAMHRGMLNQTLPDSAAAGMHTVIVADLPQDSDVFLVLSRMPRKPELVATEHFVFEIAVDGTIKWQLLKRSGQQ